MPRNRMIKPEFWSDEKTGMSLNLLEKCLFIGMLNFADDEGLIKANPLYLKSTIFPYDEKIEAATIKDSLKQLDELGLIFLYPKNNQYYAWITKFKIHQRIDKPQNPKNPAPSIQNNEYHSAVFKRDEFICHICGEYTDLQDDLNKSNSHFPSIDHVNPKNNGGTDYPSNLKTACISCNKSKDSNTNLIPLQEHSGNGIEQKKRKEKKRKESEKKEKRKEKKEKNIFVLNKWLDKNIWTAFKKYRREIRAPVTEHGEKLLIADLKKLVDAGHDQIEVVNRTIKSGKWKGFYPPTGNNNNQTGDWDQWKERNLSA